MKVKSNYSKNILGNIVISFDHYSVVQKSKNFFGVYDDCGYLITHGTTLNKATKKAKLLEMGYQYAKDKDYDYEGRWC